MNKYQFMFQKDECHKLTTTKFTLLTLVNGFSTMEEYNEKIVEICMHQKCFDILVGLSENNPFEDSVYKKVIKEKKFLGAAIVINNFIDENIIIMNGERNDGMSTLKIFIGE